jgi:hypothetical protein
VQFEVAAVQHQILRAVLIIVGGLGMLWGISGFARSAAADYFEDVEGRLLSFASYSAQAAGEMHDGALAQELSECDNHAQRSLLLLELPLADAALKAGATADFDRRVQSIEERAKRDIACTPRDPLLWLVLFGLDVQHGARDRHTFDLLATSYAVSPHEAWIGLRRAMVTIPIVQTIPDPLREQVLAEFENLINDKLPEIPARLFLSASDAARAILQPRIDRLDPKSRQAFASMLQELRR